MVRKARKTQLQFGSTAGSQEIAEFGSLAAGSAAYSTNPTNIQSRAQFLQGWVAAAVGSSPAIEDENALHFLWAYQLFYLLETGIPEWDAGTTYYVGDVVSSGDQYGRIYVSVADGQTNHAVTDAAYWRLQSGQPATTITSGKTLAAADNGTIIPCNTSGGAFSITLVLGGAPKGYFFTIKDVNGTFGSNPVSIVRIASETIEGVAATYVCNKPNRAYTFYSDGTNWWVKATSFDTKPGVGDFIGEAGAVTVGTSATGLNVVGNTASRYASYVQQKITAAGTSFGQRTIGGSNASDYCSLFTTAAGSDIAGMRGDKILEMIGGGIKFPATQVSSADANTLDDYEEGGFTPSISYPTPGTSSFGFAIRDAAYVKIGRYVFVSGVIVLNAFTKGSAAGTLRITGLPFANSGGVANIVISSISLVNWTFSVVPQASLGPSATTLDLIVQQSGGAVSNINDPASNSSIYFNCYYLAAS